MKPAPSRTIIRSLAMALMLGGCSCVGEGHDCELDSASCDAGTDADTVPDGSAVPPRPFCDLTYAFAEGPDFRPPVMVETAQIPPPVPDAASASVAALRLEVGESGLRSWWVRGDTPLRLTLGVSVGSDVSSVSHTVRVFAVVNGRIGRVRRVESEWEEVLTTSQAPGVASLTSTIEIERTGFEEGLNSLSLVYVLETPSTVPTTRTGTFPNLNVFVNRTGGSSPAVDNEALELSAKARLPRRPSFVTLGEDGPMVSHLRDPGSFEAEGLWVHLQSTEELTDCGHDNAMSLVALLDGRPLPIGPEGATSLLVSVGSTERLAFRLPSLDLPSNSGHSLLLVTVEGVGYPFEADDGWLSPWGRGGQLLLLEW